MTLPELFHTCNLAGIRLANVNGQLELRGRAIPNSLKAGALEHKTAILALLPPAPTLRTNEETPLPGATDTLSSFVRSPSASKIDEADQAEEDKAVMWERGLAGAEAAAIAAEAIEAWDAMVEANGLADKAVAWQKDTGWPADLAAQRRRGEHLDAIDRHYLAGDLASLRAAVAALCYADVVSAIEGDQGLPQGTLTTWPASSSCSGCVHCAGRKNVS